MSEPLARDETTLDLRQVFQVVHRYHRLILVIFMAIVTGTLLLSLIIPPTYEAETRLRIRQSPGLSDSLLGGVPVKNTFATIQLMSTYAEILKSPTVIQTVVEKNSLAGNRKTTYRGLFKRINAQPVRDTEILRVSVRARSGPEAQWLANTLVTTFIERLAYLARSKQQMVREFIGDRLEDAKLQLEQAETALELYKRNQQIVAPDEETQALVDHMAAINRLSAENTVNLATARARLDSSQQQLAAEKPEFIGDSPLIQQYRAKLGELEVRLVGLLQKYTEKHPQVQATRAEISEVKTRLNLEINRVVNAEAASMNPIHQGLLQTRIQSETEIAASLAQKEALTKLAIQNQRQLAALPQKEHGLAIVMREAAVNRDIYIMLAKRYEEAGITEVMQPTDVQIIDLAMVPTDPIKPNLKYNLALAALVGLFMAFGIVYSLDYFQRNN